MRVPQLPAEDIYAVLDANKVNRKYVCLLAIRGYWLDSIGEKGKNDRRRYDDALLVCLPDGRIFRCVWNTDANGYRKGKGTGAGKGMAMLQPGVWLYGTGLHKGREAFRQCGPVTVLRDGNPDYEDTGWFAIDLHDGGGDEDDVGTTWSEGCQTAPPRTWKQLKPFLYQMLDTFLNPRRKNDRGEYVRSFEYCLIDETERRAGNLVVPNRKAA